MVANETLHFIWASTPLTVDSASIAVASASACATVSSEIARWTKARRETLAAREIDDIRRAVDHLNLTTQWAQSRATDAELDAVTDDLLLAMHDLRSTLVRKKADRMDRS